MTNLFVYTEFLCRNDVLAYAVQTSKKKQKYLHTSKANDDVIH